MAKISGCLNGKSRLTGGSIRVLMMGNEWYAKPAEVGGFVVHYVYVCGLSMYVCVVYICMSDTCVLSLSVSVHVWSVGICIHIYVCGLVFRTLSTVTSRQCLLSLSAVSVTVGRPSCSIKPSICRGQSAVNTDNWLLSTMTVHLMNILKM